MGAVTSCPLPPVIINFLFFYISRKYKKTVVDIKKYQLILVPPATMTLVEKTTLGAKVELPDGNEVTFALLATKYKPHEWTGELVNVDVKKNPPESQ